MYHRKYLWRYMSLATFALRCYILRWSSFRASKQSLFFFAVWKATKFTKYIMLLNFYLFLFTLVLHNYLDSTLLLFTTQRAHVQQGVYKAIGFVCLSSVVVSIKIARYWDLGIWVTHKHNESIIYNCRKSATLYVSNLLVKSTSKSNANLF